jgi:Fe-S cluster assembly ATP-binding protein
MYYFMINIEKLKVWVEKKEILKGIDMQIELWKNYCLLWKNWSGKSTLASFLMWHPKYNYISWKIEITDSKKNEKLNLLNLTPEERSKLWIFLSFQNVPEIKWIKLSEFLRTIYNLHKKNDVESSLENVKYNWLSPFIFKRFIKKYLDELHIEESFLDRDLNYWFSWWEKRKIEILQMKLIWPKYIILDEIDSWLDLNAFKKVAELLKSINSKYNSLIIITHYFNILDYVQIDKVFVLKDWVVVDNWWNELIEKIKKDWYIEEKN